MKTESMFIFSALLLLGCGRVEYASTSDIQADWGAYADREVRIAGRRVAEHSNMRLVTTGGMDYITIEDASGEMQVWYNGPRLRIRCPPRIGSELTVAGTVREISVVNPDAAEMEIRRIFAAETISIDSEPPLDSDKVRLCQLSLEEQSRYAYEGPDGLEDHWRATGKPVRTVVEY